MAKPANPVDRGDEQDLVRRAQRGDLAAYDDLVRRYQQRIYATIYHMTANHEDANDLAQETFIKAFQALKSFKGDSSFYTWIYRIAVNKTINFLKQRSRRAHISLNDLDFNAEHDPDLVALISDKTPRREVALAELQEKLNEAMLKLSEPHRLVVTLHDVQGMSHDEIAEIMDCNIGTVRSRLVLRAAAVAELPVGLFEISMNSENDNFDQIQRMLKLKRYEQPPPRYFNDFSSQDHRPDSSGRVGALRRHGPQCLGSDMVSAVLERLCQSARLVRCVRRRHLCGVRRGHSLQRTGGYPSGGAWYERFSRGARTGQRQRRHGFEPDRRYGPAGGFQHEPHRPDHRFVV